MRAISFWARSSSVSMLSWSSILPSRTLFSMFSTAQASSATSVAPTIRPLPLMVW